MALLSARCVRPGYLDFKVLDVPLQLKHSARERCDALMENVNNVR